MKATARVAFLSSLFFIGFVACQNMQTKTDQTRGATTSAGAKGAAANAAVTGPAAPNPIAQLEAPPSPTASPASPSPSPTPRLDPAVVSKAETVFEPLASNDEKKAKLAYGRASRHLPELVQFAVDLRFQNYEHAVSLMDHLPMGDVQRSFWKSVIEKKPKNLSRAVCDAIKKSADYPPPSATLNIDDLAWDDVFNDVVKKQAEGHGDSGQANTYFDEKLTGFKCDEKEPKPDSGYCGPLSEEQQKDLLQDSFFDKLHNDKRRDTRYVRAHYKDPEALAAYRKQAFVKSLKDLLLFFRSVHATKDYARQAHFVRRFKSIGRDMKPESLLNRAVGDVLDGDKADEDFTSALLRFKDENQLVVDLTRLDYELAADCLKQ